MTASRIATGNTDSDYLDAGTIDAGLGPAKREAVFVADRDVAAALAGVAAAPPGPTAYGLAVRPIGLVPNIDAAGTWQAVPTSAGDAIASTCRVLAIIFTNTNASPQTVTVLDKSGSPLTVIPTFSIPANSIVRFPFDGAIFTGGVRWSAGGTGVNGCVQAYQ